MNCRSSGFQALISKKAKGIDGIKYMPELNQTLGSSVQEIRMEKYVGVLPPLDYQRTSEVVLLDEKREKLQKNPQIHYSKI